MDVVQTKSLPASLAEHLGQLFSGFSDYLAVSAALAGQSPATVYLDDLLQPNVALLHVQRRFFLAGNANLPGVIQALNNLFKEQLYPQARAAGDEGYVLHFTEHWANVIKDGVLAGMNSDLYWAQYYHFHIGQEHLNNQPPMALPDGFSIQIVDRKMVERQDLENRHELFLEMQSERPSVDAFLEKSFGLVLIKGNCQVAGWCLSEYNLGDRCEVGIAVDARFRRLGLGTALGKAFIDQAVGLGYREIGWHCWQWNQPSQAAALKIGFAFEHERPAYLALIDQPESLE